MKQFIRRNFSSPEQRGRAVALFIKLEILVYLVIILGITIFVVKVFL